VFGVCACRNLVASSTPSGDALLQASGAAVVVDAARSLPAAAARIAALGTLLVLSMDAAHRQAITAAGMSLFSACCRAPFCHSED
jgi:hypothetical protein